MKNIRILFLILVSSPTAWGQTNIFPSSGNVGVGTINPDSKLHILQSPSGLTATNVTGLFVENNGSSNEYYVLQTATTGGSKSFSITNAGNVGIGTITPSEKLQINGNTSILDGNMIFNNTNTNMVESGTIRWNEYSNNIANISGAFIKYDGSSNYLQISTNTESINYEHLRIYRGGNILMQPSNGNVGVGTTSPGSKLHISESHSGLTATNVTGLFVENSGGSNDYYVFQTATSGGGKSFSITNAGNVGIGTTTPESKLAVNGQIRATEVKVLADISVPDYVFEPDYELRTLKETKKYIAENKHLPEIPSASEIGNNGIDLGDMNMRLLKKIEELTLYQIQLMEEMEVMKKELQELKK